MLKIKNAKEKNEDNASSKRIEVKRAKMLESGTVTFDMEINEVMIYGCWWKEGTDKNGKEYGFATLPSRKGKDGKYYSIVYIKLTDEENQLIESQIEKLL